MHVLGGSGAGGSAAGGSAAGGSSVGGSVAGDSAAGGCAAGGSADAVQAPGHGRALMASYNLKLYCCTPGTAVGLGSTRTSKVVPRQCSSE